ncbi:tryptophan synthase subunit alpha [Moraxella equi]|uniref:Tryptophan synthase alpha chain n=1 Tax=Moraxella equi TaxID=60442 RepID=A0A378QVH5_9GAMM|nr:tryptophan synthase subunit alpha [Moraxella equi]OPH39149.1 tryptophan synthase subunit alpha [Moraxella equi]STZ03443.1 Tryptophan synthase alpha chain [Moraxella equi]
MTRISQTFAILKQQNKKALIPYIMAGDPNPSVTVDLMHELALHGADIIEIGLPFSDPMADGAVISLAGERALAGGTSTTQAVQMVGEFRKTNQSTPVLLMGYLNPVEIIGYDNFLNLCEQNGVDGLLLVDLPPNETSDDLSEQLAQKAINQIFLLAPTTEKDRRQAVLKRGSGFIYYVSVKGVTGSRALNTDEVARQVQAIKADTELPICVGFGIRDGESAKAVATFADGVIVGSELVRHFADVGDDKDKLELAIDKVLSKMDELRQAIDSL